jgi:predicted nucleic acid-binding protein
MTVFVVDASVGLKWLVPEVYQADAQRLQNQAYEPHIPTLFDVEIANALWKRIGRGELTRADQKTQERFGLDKMGRAFLLD